VYPKHSFLQTGDEKTGCAGLIDTHCHLNLEPLKSNLPQVLREAAKAGVRGMIVPGVHPDGWQRMAGLAAEYPQVVPAFGVHPMHADLLDEVLLERLSYIAPTGCAIGETGLDPSYNVPLASQELAFRRQIRLAHNLGLPLLIHCRRAFQRTFQILEEEQAGRLGGIMHAFSGSPEMAWRFIRLGFAISISATVTWSGAVKPIRLARELPLEQLVLETDAPDLPPQKYRGDYNRPAWLMDTVLRVAELRGITPEAFANASSTAVRRVLGLSAVNPV